MDPIEAALRAHPFLADLAPEAIAFLASCASSVRYEPGECLIREGDPADRLLLLQAGRVALEIHAAECGPIRVESLGGGDILGLSWLCEPGCWHLDARAVEPVEALALEAGCLLGGMEADPRLGYALSRRLLRHAIRRLERVRLQRLDLFKAEGAR